MTAKTDTPPGFSTMPKAVMGFTNADAPSAAVAPSGRDVLGPEGPARFTGKTLLPSDLNEGRQGLRLLKALPRARPSTAAAISPQTCARRRHSSTTV
jgi:hypothetical protein